MLFGSCIFYCLIGSLCIHDVYFFISPPNNPIAVLLTNSVVLCIFRLTLSLDDVLISTAFWRTSVPTLTATLANAFLTAEPPLVMKPSPAAIPISAISILVKSENLIFWSVRIFVATCPIYSTPAPTAAPMRLARNGISPFLSTVWRAFRFHRSNSPHSPWWWSFRLPCVPCGAFFVGIIKVFGRTSVSKLDALWQI